MLRMLPRKFEPFPGESIGLDHVEADQERERDGRKT